MEKSESIKAIAEALKKFQGAMQAITKDATNPFFHSKYASLSNIIADIREPLSKQGLSFAQFPSGENMLETILMHDSGEYMMASFKIEPTDRKPQSLGSAITYARRYALTSILGLQVDDDDGNEASGNRKAPTKKAYQRGDEGSSGAVIHIDTEEEETKDVQISGTDTDVVIPPTISAQRKLLATLLQKHGIDFKDKKSAVQFVADTTELSLVESNFPAIIRALS